MLPRMVFWVKLLWGAAVRVRHPLASTTVS